MTPPSYRFDIAIEEDLIEELARIHGYDNIPAAAPLAHATMLPARRNRSARGQRSAPALARPRLSRGRHATASSIGEWEEDFCGNEEPVALANPIASHMSVMRSSLIPGLVASIEYNVRHKQDRVRLFEIGRCFEKKGAEYVQPIRIAARGVWRRAARAVGGAWPPHRLLRREGRPRCVVRATPRAVRGRTRIRRFIREERRRSSMATA